MLPLASAQLLCSSGIELVPFSLLSLPLLYPLSPLLDTLTPLGFHSMSGLV